MNIKEKAVKGGFYLFIANGLSQLLAIAINIVLARLLLPKDFGLIALAATYIGLIGMFTKIGFGSAIIYEEKSSQLQLSTLYWINYIWAILVFLLIYFTVPFAARFYNEPQLTNVVRFAALNIIVSPLYTIHYKIKEHDIEFVLLSKLNISSTAIGALAAIIGAIANLGVYALVLQMVVSTISRTILILIFCRWKPSFTFNFQEVKGMIWYSLKTKASRILIYLERNIDYLILGKFFNASILGYYAFSYNIMYTPVKRISYIFSDILFPSFSAVKQSTQKLIEGLFRSLQLIALVTFPAMTLVALNAEWIVQLIFGHKWDDAIPILQILAFAGAIQSITHPVEVVFNSKGKPEINIYLSLVRTVLVTFAILVGVLMGEILSVAYAILIAKALSFIAVIGISKKIVKFSINKLLKYLAGPIVNVISLATLHLLFLFLIESNGAMKFIMMLILSMAITYIFHFKTLREIVKIIKAKQTNGKIDR